MGDVAKPNNDLNDLIYKSSAEEMEKDRRQEPKVEM